MIIATFALGAPGSIGSEEEFLLSLNRFDIMASRAPAKLMVLVSEEVAIHLAREIEVLRGSALLKRLVPTYCDIDREFVLRYAATDGDVLKVEGGHQGRSKP